MRHLTYQQLKTKWIQFFQQRQHLFIPAVNLVSTDQSLLWLNSGIAGLKDYFLGIQKPPAKRLVNIQRSIRTNDIDLIGYTNRHLTLFEMMGNFSLGDYFKVPAISWAWEFLTASKWLNLAKNRLYFTVYETDVTTINFLKTTLKIASDHILLKGKITNFWDLGVGPCGPNLEIFYDLGTKHDPTQKGIELLKNDVDNDRYLEIWNIVFTQYNHINQKYLPLQTKNIDTGAGLERLLMILQEQNQLFATDLFKPLITALEALTTVSYSLLANSELGIRQKQINTAFAIVVDHLRAITFMLADLLAIKKHFNFQTQHGYIIRRLIRRALIQLPVLGLKFPILHKLIPSVIEKYVEFTPHLQQFTQQIMTLILKEETQLLQLWKPNVLNKKIATQTILNGQTIFQMVTSEGLPLQLIQNIAQSLNVKLALTEFQRLFAQHKKISHAQSDHGFAQEWSLLIAPKEPPTIFLSTFSAQQIVIKAVFAAKKLNQYWIIVNETPFYAEKGGQVADTGQILINNQHFSVIDVQLNNKQQYLHLIEIGKKPQIGQKIDLFINRKERLLIAKNHSGTHLLHAVLRVHFGDQLKQNGSLNNQKYLRLDFDFSGKIIESDLIDVQKQINQLIQKKITPQIIYCSLEEAKVRGALTFFTDRYKNKQVRIVQFGDFSQELCGGTHVNNSGDIEQFLITNLESISKTRWRIYALTSKNTIDQFLIQQQQKFQKIIAKLKPFIKNNPDLQKELTEFQNLDFYLLQNQRYHQLAKRPKLLLQNQQITKITQLLRTYRIPTSDLLDVLGKKMCFHIVANQNINHGFRFLRFLYDERLIDYQLVVLFYNSSVTSQNLFIKVPKNVDIKPLVDFLKRDFGSIMHFGNKNNRLQGVIETSNTKLSDILEQIKSFCLKNFNV